ncbi:MAG: hypothetical protein M0042_02175 [Nitrospiraceae bacterium]|nr:hypothetical protein [Nitrospiraceae bacterium]
MSTANYILRLVATRQDEDGAIRASRVRRFSATATRADAEKAAYDAVGFGSITDRVFWRVEVQTAPENGVMAPKWERMWSNEKDGGI